MNRQDRQGVRTPAQLEQRYRFEQVFAKYDEEQSGQATQIKQLSQAFAQYMTKTNAVIAELSASVGDIVLTANGVVISLEDSSESALKNLVVYGNDTVVGASGSVTVSVGDMQISIPTPDGLWGVAVDADGDYTDANGQQWVCDMVDLARGVYLYKIGTDGEIYSPPIEKQIDEATLAAYKELRTQKPSTEIRNDFSAWMSVEYVADTKTYIDNKLENVSPGITPDSSLVKISNVYEQLWENPDTESPFFEETITLGADVVKQYDSFLVVYSNSMETNADRYITLPRYTGFEGVGVSAQMLDFSMAGNAVYPVRRNVSLLSDSVYFSDTFWDSSYDVPLGLFIPHKIYGVKLQVTPAENIAES